MSVAGGRGKWVWQVVVAGGCARWAWQVGEAHLPATPTSLTHLSHIPATVIYLHLACLSGQLENNQQCVYFLI